VCAPSEQERHWAGLGEMRRSEGDLERVIIGRLECYFSLQGLGPQVLNFLLDQF
jgi:hypothetical protein